MGLLPLLHFDRLSEQLTYYLLSLKERTEER